MKFTVIVTFGTMLNNLNTELPNEINMEFDESQAWDALDYFHTCVKYFESALKWDPSHYGFGVNATLWQGGRKVCRKYIR